MAKILTDDIIPALKEKVTSDTSTISDIMNYAGDNRLAFGLGGNCINMLTTDLDSYPAKTGFYMGHDGANRPTTVYTSDDWWYVEQLVHNDDYRVQIARSFFDGNRQYQRVKENGTWKVWARIPSTENMLNIIYPVGSIYMSGTLDTPAKVAAAIGGTWIAVEQGKVIAGYSSTDNDFNTPNGSGGAKTVTLATTQIPSHSHVINYKNVSLGSGGTIVSEVGTGYTTNTGNTGGGQAHNNLQPYDIRYIYRRSA